MTDFESITTHRGDDGKSGLLNGKRLFKDNPVFEALGDLDELSSVIGIARASLNNRPDFLLSIQNTLLTCGAMLAGSKKTTPIDENDLFQLENEEKKLVSVYERLLN